MNKAFYKNLIDSFKKSNKERKAKLALKAGFEKPEDYLESLQKSYDSAPEAEVVKDELDERFITDMVIAFDTTGSMSSYIQSVKKHVNELIPKLLSQNPGLMISVVAFGDYCDCTRISSDGKHVFGKAYQVCTLTKDEKHLINFVSNALNTSGGDSDEFYELVIKKIVEETHWRQGSNKQVLLIGDADPHKKGYHYHTYTSNIDWKEEATKAAKLDIQFDTLRIKTASWYQELSKMTNGVCIDFSNSGKTSDLIEIASLSRGGKATKELFTQKMEKNTDKELEKVYSMYKTVIER